jgi:outer membrane protein assembly factor BamB
MVADGKIYIADEDGDVAVFAASAEKKLLAENLMGDSIYGSPVAVGDTLFIATRSNLFAIEEGAKAEAPPTE